MKSPKKTPVPLWSPWGVHTWKRSQLAAWFEEFGSRALYNGRLWQPKTKYLAAGYYEVRFQEIQLS